jgi:hypothetical protein
MKIEVAFHHFGYRPSPNFPDGLVRVAKRVHTCAHCNKSIIKGEIYIDPQGDKVGKRNSRTPKHLICAVVTGAVDVVDTERRG